MTAPDAADLPIKMSEENPLKKFFSVREQEPVSKCAHCDEPLYEKQMDLCEDCEEERFQLGYHEGYLDRGRE